MSTTIKTTAATLLGLCLVAGPVLAAPRKAKTKKGAHAAAYDSIKSDRAKHVKAYTDELMDLIEQCVDEGWGDLGLQVVDRVQKLHEPPKSRRKTAGNSGVMVDAGKGQGDEGVSLRASFGKQLSDEEQKNVERIAKFCKDSRKILKRKTTEPSKGEAGRFETLRKRATGNFVDDNMKLAKKCVKKGYPSIAYELLLWTLQFDVNNKSLRGKLLKQKSFGKGKKLKWYSSFEIKKAKAGLKLDPEYGWISADDKKALKAGKMNFKGKWLPKAKVEELRRDWDNHWVFETEHFEIHTNAPLADAVEFGREVENLYRFFFRTWVGFYAEGGKRADPNLVFGGGMKLGKKLWLNYYRSRESYLEVCRTDPFLASDPLLQQSAGFYDPNNGKAFFYREDYGPNLSTIYHEVTHQIFGETKTGRGHAPPTWMVEGLAVYMEDPVVRGEIGMERLLAGAEPPPGIRPEVPRDINGFMKSTAYRDTFHGTNRSANYKTGGAVVHFFMQYNGGIYRNGFIQFCQRAYRNAEAELPTKTEAIYDLMQVTPEKLQEDWVKFNKKPTLFDF